MDEIKHFYAERSYKLCTNSTLATWKNCSDLMLNVTQSETHVQDYSSGLLFVLQLIDQEINPYVDQWEAEGTFPAHKVFKILGNAGFLGVNKPVGKLAVVVTLSL